MLTVCNASTVGSQACAFVVSHCMGPTTSTLMLYTPFCCCSLCPGKPFKPTVDAPLELMART